eukprot:m.364745 g.364745  ORF g.364745 m.364745 type:complete len:399 (+) comp28080_c0_seq24:214-1410(+)
MQPRPQSPPGIAKPCVNNCGWGAFVGFSTCCTRCTRCPHTHAADCASKNAWVGIHTPPTHMGGYEQVDADAELAWEIQCDEYKAAAAAAAAATSASASSVAPAHTLQCEGHAEEDAEAAEVVAAAEQCSLPMLAATLTERLRETRRTGIRLRYTVVNYDLALDFLQKHDDYMTRGEATDRVLPADGDPRGPAFGQDHKLVGSRRTSGSMQHARHEGGLRRPGPARVGVCPTPTVTRSTKILTVFHGTRKDNFAKIIDGNFKVPDGKHVLHATDMGYFGKGIYTAPTSGMALSYAKDGAAFVCLALPGRQFAAQCPRDTGKPCSPGYDSHFAPGGAEIVFFESCQLLPCFLVSTENIAAATAAVADAREFICSQTRNSDAGGVSVPGASSDPFSHVGAV